MTRRAIGVLMVALAASGCGGASVRTGAPSTSPPTSSERYVVVPVTRELKWDSSHLILDPPLSTTAPKISADAAYRATRPTENEDIAQVMFGLFTDASGTVTLTQGGTALTYRQHPAWIVWHRHALVAPSCAPPRPGTQSTCGPVDENTLAVIDADTGQALSLYTFP